MNADHPIPVHFLHDPDPFLVFLVQILKPALGLVQLILLIRDQQIKGGNLLVDIGGEVVLQGINDKGKEWRVGITRPTLDAMGAEKQLQEVIASNHLCMATSGNYLQYYFVDGQRRSHTIDPRTGYPVHHSLLSATVTAISCMLADALATACIVRGEQEALKMIEKTTDAACYLIIADCDTIRITTSKGWQF